MARAVRAAPFCPTGRRRDPGRALAWRCESGQPRRHQRRHRARHRRPVPGAGQVRQRRLLLRSARRPGAARLGRGHGPAQPAAAAGYRDDGHAVRAAPRGFVRRRGGGPRPSGRPRTGAGAGGRRRDRASRRVGVRRPRLAPVPDLLLVRHRPRARATGCGSSPARSPDGRVAATWTPDPSVAADWHEYRDATREVGHAVTWAALDCAGGWAADIGARLMVLGTMTARLVVAARGRRGARRRRCGPRRVRPEAEQRHLAVRRRRPPGRHRRARVDRGRPRRLQLI